MEYVSALSLSFHDLSRLVIKENKSLESDDIWKPWLLKYTGRADDTDGSLLGPGSKFQLCTCFLSQVLIALL